MTGSAWTYLLIAVVVMAALSPLITMMPSRRQRQIAALRQQAALCGMTVQLRGLPGAPPGEAPQPFYGRRRPPGVGNPLPRAIFRREGESWRAGGGAIPAPVLALLDSLPPGVGALLIEPEGAGLFWDERGSGEQVALIGEVLERLSSGEASTES